MPATDTGWDIHFRQPVTANTDDDHVLILITPRGRHGRREAGVAARGLTADTDNRHGPKQPRQTANNGGRGQLKQVVDASPHQQTGAESVGPMGADTALTGIPAPRRPFATRPQQRPPARCPGGRAGDGRSRPSRDADHLGRPVGVV